MRQFQSPTPLLQISTNSVVSGAFCEGPRPHPEDPHRTSPEILFCPVFPILWDVSCMLWKNPPPSLLIWHSSGCFLSASHLRAVPCGVVAGGDLTGPTAPLLRMWPSRASPDCKYARSQGALPPLQPSLYHLNHSELLSEMRCVFSNCVLFCYLH